MPPPVQNPFMVPQTMISPLHIGTTSPTIHNRLPVNTTVPFNDPHNVLLAQPAGVQHINMDMYNNMVEFYRQQVN
ncbi:hypothetical protein M8C21_016621 [Ambrosia artemisiifolia]|uniref:Uncharacterized protein n=1 Tax=Ambrosia artemisiifolia TaxID=4212 RepID=A0AAD5GRQ9_AMBAR|nr:hypothetical protein M8C21_016621 [Ambrosia artemisiifolia]